jgi:hypothetical protein
MSLGRQLGFNIQVVRTGGGWNWLKDHVQWWALVKLHFA